MFNRLTKTAFIVLALSWLVVVSAAAAGRLLSLCIGESGHCEIEVTGLGGCGDVCRPQGKAEVQMAETSGLSEDDHCGDCEDIGLTSPASRRDRDEAAPLADCPAPLFTASAENKPNVVAPAMTDHGAHGALAPDTRPLILQI